MKKSLIIYTILFLGISFLFGCSDNKENINQNNSTTENSKKYFDCTINFSKTKEEGNEDFYLTKELPINTDIYVHVDFNFYNLDGVDDVINFKVDLMPGMDTYSVYDYTKGPIEPTIPDHDQDFIDDDGMKKVIEISGMEFNIEHDKEKKHYFYIFVIKASKISDDCNFKVIFTPKDGNFNDGRTKSFSNKFKLVDNDLEGN